MHIFISVFDLRIEMLTSKWFSLSQHELHIVLTTTVATVETEKNS